MTNYELLALAVDTLANLQALFANYMTLLFAFLVTTYLVAARLTRGMSAIALVLFTALAISQIVEMWLVNGDVEGISAQLRARVAAGDDAVAWHGLVVNHWEGDVITASQLISAIGGYFAAIAFFVHERRHPRRG